jgi:hypothetical protein
VYLAPDDAKSDVILAAATTVFGVALQGFVSTLPLYPRQGVTAVVLDLVWVLALTALVPFLLARYRGDRAAAFGLDAPRAAAASPGIVLALPVAVLGVVTMVLTGIDPVTALLGRFGPALTGPGAGGVVAAIGLASVPVLAVGGLLLVTFLAGRSQEGFPRSPDTSMTELLRTYGTGALAVATVLGLLRAIPGGAITAVSAVAHVLAIAAMLAVADRQVSTRTTVPRTTVVTPVVIVVVAHVFAAGGLFRGDLLRGLYTGALAAATTVVIAALCRSRIGAWAVVPLMVAVAWWPSCLSPLALDPGLC